jgi:hypothetical protein
MIGRKSVILVIGLLFLGVAGCKGPEDGRPRGGGHGADARNYIPGAVHVPSKIDGTKSWPYRPSS